MAKEKVIPIFLDWNGTIDKALTGTTTKLQAFLKAVQALEKSQKAKCKITFITRALTEVASERFDLFKTLSCKLYPKMADRFFGAMAEFDSFFYNGETVEILRKKNPAVEAVREEVAKLTKSFGGTDYPYKTYLSPEFNCTKEDFETKIFPKFKKLQNNKLEVSCAYLNEYTSVDIIPFMQNKGNGVAYVLEQLKLNYSFTLVVSAGDEYKLDNIMAETATNLLRGKGKSVFIATGKDSRKPINKTLVLYKGDNVSGLTKSITEMAKSLII